MGFRFGALEEQCPGAEGRGSPMLQERLPTQGLWSMQSRFKIERVKKAAL